MPFSASGQARALYRCSRGSLLTHAVVALVLLLLTPSVPLPVLKCLWLWSQVSGEWGLSVRVQGFVLNAHSSVSDRAPSGSAARAVASAAALAAFSEAEIAC